VLFVGPSGTGKSHLATALGMAACAQGRKVRGRELFCPNQSGLDRLPPGENELLFWISSFGWVLRPVRGCAGQLC
jgi:hypothetical protein